MQEVLTMVINEGENFENGVNSSCKFLISYVCHFFYLLLFVESNLLFHLLNLFCTFLVCYLNTYRFVQQETD